MIECIQYPGETIFVPGGWWHAVLNLDDTMAVTQNFCNSSNFDRVWRSMRVGRKKLSEYFLRRLRDKNPMFYRQALQLNKQDKFIFYSQRQKPNFLIDNTTDTWTDSSSSTSSTYSDTSNAGKISNPNLDKIDSEKLKILIFYLESMKREGTISQDDTTLPSQKEILQQIDDEKEINKAEN